MLIIGKMLLRGRAVPQGLPRGEYLVQDPASHIGESIPTHTCSSCAPLLPHPSPPTYLAHRLEVVALAHHLVLLGQAVLAECIAAGEECVCVCGGGGCVWGRNLCGEGADEVQGAGCPHRTHTCRRQRGGGGAGVHRVLRGRMHTREEREGGGRRGVGGGAGQRAEGNRKPCPTSRRGSRLTSALPRGYASQAERSSTPPLPLLTGMHRSGKATPHSPPTHGHASQRNSSPPAAAVLRPQVEQEWCGQALRRGVRGGVRQCSHTCDPTLMLIPPPSPPSPPLTTS